MKYLDKPGTVEEIAIHEFKNQGQPANQFEEFWAKVMIQKHIDNLLRKKLIHEVENGRWIRI
jgi:hypothetical protein